MKTFINSKNTFQSHNMKSSIEFIFAWFLGIVIPILIYLKMVLALILLDCFLGTLIAYRSSDFRWKKFFETIAKGAGFALLLVVFQVVYTVMSIPDIDINGLKFTMVTFLAGMIAYHEAKSIEKKTIALWGFAFLLPLERRFTLLQEFKNDTTQNQSTDTTP